MTGPISTPPPSGPGRVTPLTEAQRTDNYRRQTGSARLTPRQRRRVEHKAARALNRA
jgi:hypothetical protein